MVLAHPVKTMAAMHHPPPDMEATTLPQATGVGQMTQEVALVGVGEAMGEMEGEGLEEVEVEALMEAEGGEDLGEGVTEVDLGEGVMEVDLGEESLAGVGVVTALTASKPTTRFTSLDFHET
jgi:hypothetical protein